MLIPFLEIRRIIRSFIFHHLRWFLLMWYREDDDVPYQDVSSVYTLNTFNSCFSLFFILLLCSCSTFSSQLSSFNFFISPLTGFLNRDVHSESLDSESSRNQEHLLKPLKSVVTVSSSNLHDYQPSTTGLPAPLQSPYQQRRFPLDQNHPLHPGPLNKSIGSNVENNAPYMSPMKKGGPSITSSDRDSDSPSSKLPPSPVLRMLRSAREESRRENLSESGSIDSPLVAGGKKKITKKRSNLLDSSSSEEEATHHTHDHELIRKKSSSTDDSTPSPRTPNSYKILSGIERNQATAFDFPPSPFINSRPSSYERHSDRQSSDDFSTTISSFRSRSTSSDVFDDASNCSTNLVPIPLPTKNRKASPLRKQQAIITEEVSPPAVHNKGWFDVQTEADSGVSDGTFPLTPPRSCRGGVGTRESTSSTEDTPTQKVEAGDAEVEPLAIFRKVTIRKKHHAMVRSPSPRRTESDPHYQDMEPRPSSEPLNSACPEGKFKYLILTHFMTLLHNWNFIWNI